MWKFNSVVFSELRSKLCEYFVKIKLDSSTFSFFHDMKHRFEAEGQKIHRVRHDKTDPTCQSSAN